MLSLEKAFTSRRTPCRSSPPETSEGILTTLQVPQGQGENSLTSPRYVLSSRDPSTLRQIHLFISQIIIRIPQNGLQVFFLQLAAELARRSHPQRSRLNNRLLRNQSTRANDRTGADHRAIQNDRPHADQALVLDTTPMQRDGVPHGDTVADVHAVLLLHPVQNAAVLNVGMRADANLVDISADDGVHPHAGVFGENDVADDLRGVIHVTRCGDGWRNSLVRTDHRLTADD